MSIVNELVAACRSVLDVVSKIENVKEEWFTASHEYIAEAEILRGMLTNYEEQVRIHQQPADSTMMRTLKKAELTLKRAEARLEILGDHVNSEGCCSPFWWAYARISLIFLPELLQNTLKKVNEELERIPKVLKAEKENSSLMQDAAERRAIFVSVHNNDNKYVPIEASQSEVIKAIEDENGPRMILLHGGVGKGKSTLARYIWERYASSGESKGTFDHVIMVSCGNCSISDLAAKQCDILRDHSPNSWTDKTNLKNVGSKARIEHSFKSFFMGKKLLMVLDDVSDKDLLYKMWEAARDGKDDKILITSLWSNICDDFKNDSVLIPMGSPNQEEARKMLASLVGLENQTIPTHLEGVADKIIQATDGNPLALACLASHFVYNPDKKNKRDWNDAWKELPKQLDRRETTIVLGRNDDITASRSLWETIKRCIESLETKDALRILVVMYACKGESVPEEVLRILCGGLQISSSTFTRSIYELHMKELLKKSRDRLASKIIDLDKIEIDEDLQSSPSPAWCLQSLVKLYMESHVAGEQEVTAVVGALLGNDDVSDDSNIKSKVQDCDTEIAETRTEIAESDEMRVTIALCALYFDRGHPDKVVTRGVTKACQISNLVDSDDDINDLRRKAIEPLIWLLDKPEDEQQWTEVNKGCVRKVLLEYICKRQLDNENISYLLQLGACPWAQLATLEAISQILGIEEQRLLKEDSISFLHAVLDLLNAKEGVHTVVQEAASRALGDICWKAVNDESTTLVANVPGLLDVLVQSLANPKSDEVAENVANALKELAYQADDVEGDAVRQKILEKEGVIASLVNYLHQQGNRGLQEAAAAALRNLAAIEDSSLLLGIVNEKRALGGLVSCLSNDDSDELQSEAAKALSNLAATQSLKLRIVNEEGFLAGLVTCLSKKDVEIDAQIAAVRLTSSIAGAPDSKAILKETEGILQGLTNLVGENVSSEVRYEAVEALLRIDPKRAEEAGLFSAQLDNASALSARIFVKAQSGDFQGALDDANEALEMSDVQRIFVLQERGVLKRMIGDLDGALADLDEGLKLEPNDYEMLKHRGWVKCLKDDVEGARADAAKALSFESSKSYRDDFLGATPAVYLDYNL